MCSCLSCTCVRTREKNISNLFANDCSILQPEPALAEKYQLARAVVYWYCSAKMVRQCEDRLD